MEYECQRMKAEVMVRRRRESNLCGFEGAEGIARAWGSERTSVKRADTGDSEGIQARISFR